MLLYGRAPARRVKIEYEEFESVEDLFTYLSAAALPVKNTMPVHSYKGHVLSVMPLGHNADTYVAFFTKNPLEPGIYEFDVGRRASKKVESIERADKHYFVCVTPTRNTIADELLGKL